MTDAELRKEIALMMSDGKERTAADVSHRIGMKGKSGKAKAYHSLRRLEEMNLVQRSTVQGVLIWSVCNDVA